MSIKKHNLNPHIPELGEVLKFVLDCFDIRRDGNSLTHKQVERLAKGKDLSQESAEKVARTVLDTIWQELNGHAVPMQRTGGLMMQWTQNPQQFAGLPVDERGAASMPEDQILRDLIEFCWRHQFVLAGLEDSKGTPVALQYWLSGFVIPYIASTLVDYHFTANQPESGMPGGRLWYLPKIELPQDPATPCRIMMPSQQVLLWWEDLLGKSLESFGQQLCGATSDPDSARRQIAAWKKEAKPPDSIKIQTWTKQTWDYQGIFLDNPGLPRVERWHRCRDFLAGKGMLGESDWNRGTKDSSLNPVRSLASAYRGERLEEEIPPFHDFPFAKFFKSADPIGESLPVEALIQRVAARWRIPTRTELHSRLMLGRAMTLAWNNCSKTLGAKNALDLIRWASCCYNHFMMLCQKSDRLSAAESMRIHSQTADASDPGFYPIAAMLDDRYWLGLPAHLRMWIRGEVVFKES